MPLKVRTCPADAPVRSRFAPCSFRTEMFCWVPLTSPENGPITFHAAFACSAGTSATSGES